MAVRSIQGKFMLDTELDDGFVRSAYGCFFMSIATYRALARQSLLQRLVEALAGQEGTRLIPRSVIEPEAAEDLLLSLSVVDPEWSETCIHPPCILPAEVDHPDGFRLCHEHAALLQSWDDLAVA